MKKKVAILVTTLIVTASLGKSKAEITPVPFNKVTLTEGFWKDRMKTEIENTIPFSVEQSEPAIERFRRCAAFLAGEETPLPNPHRFISSDLYKVMEGVAYSLMINPDSELEEFMDHVIDLIAASQEEDGYIYISHTCGNATPDNMGEKPYTWVVHSHELYNVGHMYEAAVAYYQATGKRKLLDVSEKNALHINKVFFEGGDPSYNGGKPIMQAPGHEEIELALCKLYRVTGKELYLDMAKKFLDIRGVTYIPNGEGVMSPTYAQQHAPVAEQTEAVGHAVRAAYLYTAMAQVDALTGKDDYAKALNSIWSNLVTTRMHITGGLGAVEGVEGFGEPYDLPNLNTYNETCAAVANVFFNNGMYLTSGDAKYLDIAELSLFNNALAGINLNGDRFFYVNPLEADGVRRFNHGMGGRAEWFGCACCPPNISRLILQVPGYMYSYGDRDIYLTLYGGSKTTIPLKGTDVELNQSSLYPFDGNVTVEVNPKKTEKFAIRMRIPTWVDSDEFVPGGLYPFHTKNSESFMLKVNGKAVNYSMDRGFAVVDRQWSKGDVVELELPMPVRFVDCNPLVEVNRGASAVTRGPLVYCAEEIDNGGMVQRLFYGDAKEGDSKVETISDGILKGINEITFPAQEKIENGSSSYNITMIPYYAWCNRGDDMTMAVWLKDKESSVDLSMCESVFINHITKLSASSNATEKNSVVEAICDGDLAASSSDLSTATWISQKGSGSEWVHVVFNRPLVVKSVSVYWLDSEVNKAKVPESWSVEYKVGGKWHDLDLYVTDSYQVGINRFNVVHPANKIAAREIKINIKPQEDYRVGISELKFE